MYATVSRRANLGERKDIIQDLSDHNLGQPVG